MIVRLASFLQRHSTGVGVVLIVVTLAVAVALLNRPQLEVAFGDNEEISAVFDRGYRLDPYGSKVKIAGVDVGTVTAVEERGGDVVVTMAVDRGSRAVLGSEPSAEVRPHTLLGGNYYVALAPGGDETTSASDIPVDRTTVPVELDGVLEVLQEDARDGAVTATSQLDEAMAEGGAEEVQQFVRSAPDTLEPAAGVLDALRGRDQDSLAELVVDLEAVTATLTEDPDELEQLLASTAGTAAVLESTTTEQQQLLTGLAARLRSTRDGMADLEGSLSRLREVAEPLRPSVRELDDVLARAEPVLDEALPVVRDLRPAAADLRPVVGDLQPIAVDARSILGDVEGPALTRLNEVIVPSLNQTYRGEDELFREELGYMFAALAGISQYTDVNGPAVSFQPGLGIETLGGTPIPLPRLVGDPRDPQPGEGTP